MVVLMIILMDLLMGRWMVLLMISGCFGGYRLLMVILGGRRMAVLMGTLMGILMAELMVVLMVILLLTVYSWLW